MGYRKNAGGWLSRLTIKTNTTDNENNSCLDKVVGMISKSTKDTVPNWAASAILLAVGIGANAAWAATAPQPLVLTVKNQVFTPRVLSIPAGRQVEIILKNEDALPAEFESSDLNREKVIPGGSSLPLYVGPLSPGRYPFLNDFNPASTGTIVVVPAQR